MYIIVPTLDDTIMVELRVFVIFIKNAQFDER